MNKASDEMSQSAHHHEQGQEMVSTDESMPMPPSFEQQQETLTIITQDFFANQMVQSQIIERHLNAICNIPDLGLGQNQIHVLAKHIAEINSERIASFKQLKHICTSIYDQDITSELLSESQEDADSDYNEWASTNLEQQQTAQWPESAARKSLTSHTPLSDEESQKTYADDSVSMSRDSMSTEGDDCQSLNKSCKRRLIYSSEQQKKRSRRTAKDSDANTNNRAFAQKERELERRREEIEIRERALAEAEKEKQARQAAAGLEHQQKLDAATAEAEKRLLQIQQETKAEAEKLEMIQQAKAEAERKEDDKLEEARLVVERRLVDSRRKIEGLPRRLDKHHVVVVAVSLLDAVIRKVDDALDPCNPNLALVPKITNDLIIVLQVIARYKKMLGKFTTKKEAGSIDTLLDINVHQSIGAIAARIEKNKANKEDSINYQVPDDVKHLKNALHRLKTGDDCTEYLESQITSTDINTMKAAFRSDQAAENLLLNCIHISLMVYVEESLTVEQLFENHGDKGLRQAEELWKAVLSGVLFNAAETSMLEFRQKVLLPALADEKLREDAVQVNCDFANYLTNLNVKGRGDIVRPAFANAQRKKFDGSDAAEECKEDYCAGPGDKLNRRRSKMTMLQANLSAPDAIQQRLPRDLFPDGLRRALLLNSSSFCKESCNFVSRGSNNKPGFFDRGHNINDTVKGIQEKLKYTNDVGEKNIIIDREEKEKVIGSLKSLFA